MNRKEKIVDQMELLGIQDVTTNRQHRNGTRVWRLPIKNNNSGKTFIEVASFATGYVRNQNSGYSNYQLNKRCENKPEYWKDYEWNDDMTKQTFTGKYRKFVTRGCKLIPNEIDRLEYLISYCLKNYYIKLANQVVEGKYVSKWEHEWELEKQDVKLEKVKTECNHAYDCGLSDGETKANETYSENTGAMHRIGDLEEKLEMTQNEYKNREIEVNDLQEKLDAMTEARDCYKDKLSNVKNKLALIEEWAGDIKGNII